MILLPFGLYLNEMVGLLAPSYQMSMSHFVPLLQYVVVLPLYATVTLIRIV